jgi:DNA-binding CsgD family transcriptional regulator/tetratricopeptide (TPR) repeat protein
VLDPVVNSPYCLGRDAELETVRGLLHGAALGEGAALLWVGESGVGKSRFLRECAATKAAAASVSLRCGAPAAIGLDVRALETRVKRQPVALFVDDLHLASEGERAFVRAAVTVARRHRLVVIACGDVRSSEDEAWQRSGAAIRALQPLPDPAMELLVRGLAGARTLAADDVREIVKTAQGNPRLGIELVGGAMRNGGGAFVPPSVRAAVAELRAALSRSEFNVLRACSAIGDAFCGDWVAGVTGRPRGEVADALQRATDLGVLAEAAWSPRWLTFCKVAVRKALYASLVALKRRILHERILECLVDAEGDEHADVLLAHHAEIVEDHARAAAAFERAADRSRDGTAFSEAAELYARAAAHTPRGSAGWLSLQRQAMRCHSNAGNWRRMTSVARSVLDNVDRARDPATAAAALDNLFFAQLNEGGQDVAEGTAREIASLGLPDSENRGRIANLILAYNLCYTARLAEAARLVATVEPHHLADDEVRLRYFIAKAEVGALAAPIDRTMELVERAAESARRLAIRGTVHCYASGAEIACRYGDLEKARECLKSAEAVAVRSAGAVNDVRRRVLKERTRIAVLAGDLLVARELVRTNIGWRESGRHNEAFDAGVAVLIGMRVGDRALVDAFFDPQLLYDSVTARDAESCGVLLAGFAEVMQVRGMARDLRGVVERCIEERLIDPYVAVQLCAARIAPVECAARAADQAEEYLRDAVAPAAEAHVAMCRATLLRRQGRNIAAAEPARDAADRFAEIGWRLYAAMALELAGNTRAASRAYERCGAGADVARLAAGETRKLKHAPFGARLSPREREVAQLVAAKRSNREIARALEISVRTVDHHVEAAFSKLGIRVRWELAAEMLEPRARPLRP